MYALRIFRNGTSSCLPLREPALTVGRSGENDIVLDDPCIPAVALRMAAAEGGYLVTSASPELVPEMNGAVFKSGVLRPGDSLRIGPFLLVFDIEASGEGAPSSAPDHPRLREGLTRLCALVAEERDLEHLLAKAMNLLLTALGGDEAFLFTLDASGNPEVFVSTHPGRREGLFSDTVVREALKSPRGIRVANALSDPDFAGSQSVIDLKLHSVLCSPMRAAGKLLGLIYIGSKRPASAFGPAELEDLEAFALVLGCLVNHVVFIGEQGRLIAAMQAADGSGLVGSSDAMAAVKAELDAVAESDISVLLQGETGTGKDLAAKVIHSKSRRRDKPFLVVNCSTLRGELLASELFGHRKGAFTGALQDHKGIFRSADGGTLLLDEIGEMDPQLQAMLLRVLETGMVRPLGSVQEMAVDVRILCATNRDLAGMVDKGTFRGDLYYRINQHAIAMPPLRERGGDVVALAHHFLEKAKMLYPAKRIEGFQPESLSALLAYDWPGNVRELMNAVNKAVLFASSPAVTLRFPDRTGRWAEFEEATRQFQRDYVQKALAACQGDKEKAAAMLGMGRSTFFRYLAQARAEGDQ